MIADKSVNWRNYASGANICRSGPWREIPGPKLVIAAEWRARGIVYEALQRAIFTMMSGVRVRKIILPQSRPRLPTALRPASTRALYPLYICSSRRFRSFA